MANVVVNVTGIIDISLVSLEYSGPQKKPDHLAKGVSTQK